MGYGPCCLEYPEPHYVDPASACDDRSTIEAKSQAADFEARNKAQGE